MPLMTDVIFGAWVGLLTGILIGHWAATRRLMARLRRFVRCEDCHCTEAWACYGGCAWNPAYLEVDRYICIACRPIGEGP